MKLSVLLFLALPLAGQNAADIMNVVSLARSNNTVVLTVTASQGDGTSCTLTKIAGGSIGLVIACVSGDAKMTAKTETIRATGTTFHSIVKYYDDVACVIGINPTTAAVTAGSLGSVPANGVAWDCSTFIRTAGSITGNTADVTGSVVFP